MQKFRLDKNPDDAWIRFVFHGKCKIAPHNYHIIGSGNIVDIPKSYVGLVLPNKQE
jgi:dUTPase